VYIVHAINVYTRSMFICNQFDQRPYIYATKFMRPFDVEKTPIFGNTGKNCIENFSPDQHFAKHEKVQLLSNIF